MKTKLSILLCTLTLVLYAQPLYAKENSTLDNNAYAEYVAEQLGGEAISLEDVPVNVTPIEFDSIEEAKEYLVEEEQKMQKVTPVDVAEEPLAPSSRIFKRAASNTATKTKSFNIDGVAFLNVYANYTYANNKFTSVTSVTTSHTGLTIGNSWVQDTYSSSITDSGNKLNVTVYGHYDHYILVNTTLTRIGSSKANYSASWTY